MTEQRRKRIAFLSFDWDYEVVSEYYLGMQEYVQDRPDIQLVIFNAYGHYHVNFVEDSEAGTIFTLCDMDEFDGFIVQGNRVWGPEARQDFVDQARAAGKPVVSINYALDGAHVVGTDNYQAMYDLVDRLLGERNIDRPAFVNGLETSAEAQNRARGYRDACADHGIIDPQFYQASWQIEDGEDLARLLLADEKPLPQIFFCCNDDLAIGMQEIFVKQGVRVPEDVMFCGFDNREISRCVVPRVTTVDRDHRSAGSTAIDAIYRLLCGEELARDLFSPVRYYLRGSTGHKQGEEPTDTDSLFSVNNSLKRFYEVLTSFQSSVYGARSLASIFHVCEYFASAARCPNLYMSISDRYLHFDSVQDLGRFAPISHLVACQNTDGLAPCDERHIYESYPAEEILPASIPMDAPLYVIYPLRQGKDHVGIVVTEGVSPTMGHGFLPFCLTMLSAGMINMRNVELLRMANSRLDNLYVHDELTGLFNRFGLERFGTPAYDHMLHVFGRAHIHFVDVDYMKSINDTYGHDAGDDALQDTADVIRRATTGEDAFYMRYGGDEFLIICNRNIAGRLKWELELLNHSATRPYTLELSIGDFEVSDDDPLSLSEAIQRADSRMYDIKKHRR